MPYAKTYKKRIRKAPRKNRKRVRRVFRKKTSIPPTITQLLPKTRSVRLNSDVYCVMSTSYGATVEKLDIQWNTAMLPWNQTFHYNTGNFTRTLGTATPATQSSYGLTELLGASHFYDSFRVVSSKLVVTVSHPGTQDLPIIALIPYNWYQGAWSTAPDNIQDMKVMPNARVKQCTPVHNSKISINLTGPKAFGVTKSAYMSDNDFAARYTTVPTNYGMIRFAIQNAFASNFTSSLSFHFRLHQTVVLYNSDTGDVGDT